MNHQVIYPPYHLQRYVRYYWIIDYESKYGQVNTLDIFADVYPRMVFQHNNGNSAFSIDNQTLPISYISGLKTQFTQFSIIQGSIVLVSFFPDALKVLFGVDSNELTNEHPCLNNFAPKSLTNSILESFSNIEKIEHLNVFLTKRLISSKSNLDFVFAKALNCFGDTTNENNIRLFRSLNGVSERQLERKFKINVGISPKQFLRLKRFEKSIIGLKASTKSLSELAFSLDYFDQSHFTREFREFSGMTPNTFRNKNIITGEGNAILT